MNQLIISAATEGEVNPLVPNVWEMGVVLVGFAILMFMPRMYESSASILVEPRSDCWKPTTRYWLTSSTAACFRS